MQTNFTAAVVPGAQKTCVSVNDMLRIAYSRQGNGKPGFAWARSKCGMITLTTGSMQGAAFSQNNQDGEMADRESTFVRFMVLLHIGTGYVLKL
jgi:hypothetical protein